MLKFLLVGVISTAFASVALQGRIIPLSNGEIVRLKAVMADDLTELESQFGCTVQCANSCLSFESTDLSVQCMNTCGCSSLLETQGLPDLEKTTNLIDGDISVDVFFPRSDSGDTEIFIQSGRDGARVTVDGEYDQKNKEYEVDVTINSNRGSQRKDEVVIVAAGKQNSTGTYDVVAYENARGDSGYVYVQKEEAVKQNNDTVVVENYEYVEVHSENRNGKNKTAYVEHEKVTTANSTTIVVEEGTKGEAGRYNYEDESTTVITGNNTHVQGKQTKEFEWWVNTQAIEESAGSWSWLEILVLASVLVAVALIAYRKYAQMALKASDSTERLIQNESSYIRL